MHEIKFSIDFKICIIWSCIFVFLCSIINAVNYFQKLGEHFSTVEICFLIEASDTDSLSWTIEMPTKSSMFSFVSALKTPWEDVFAVPLPLSITKNSS